MHAGQVVACMKASKHVQVEIPLADSWADAGIALDMLIPLKSGSGAICTLSPSLKNDALLGSVFRYVGDTATGTAHYDDLSGRQEREPIDLSQVEREGRDPNGSIRSAGLLPRT